MDLSRRWWTGHPVAAVSSLSGAADAVGDLYIADSNNQRIRLVTAATGLMTTVAGNGIAGFGGDGGPATQAQLNTPTDVKLDGAGNFYIVDSGNHVVRMVNPSTGLIWTVAGIGGQVRLLRGQRAGDPGASRLSQRSCV